jgi:putative transposase
MSQSRQWPNRSIGFLALIWAQRAMMHSWAFARLGSFLPYKARAAGVAFVQVDAHTSQTCSRCGWVDKRNRLSQSDFKCGRCRFLGHADHNAALNDMRGVEHWSEVMRPHAAPTLTAIRAEAASLCAPRTA